MKIFRYSILLSLIIAAGCKDGFIDEINAVDPGPDEAAPSVIINFPLSTTQIRVLEDVTSINIRFEVTDDIEIETITLNLDGSEIASFSEFIDFRRVDEEYVYDGLTNGPHSLTVTAIDTDGKSTSSSVDFEKTEPYEPMDGEVLYIPFDGEVTDLITLTSGSTTTGVGFVDGVNLSAISFDAAFSSYALFDPTESITELESFTLSYWVNPDFVDEDSNNAIDGVLGLVNLSNVTRFWGNIDLFVENGSNPTDGADMRLHITHTDITGSTSETWITNVNDVPDFFGEWSHQVLSYDASSSEFKYYINGVLMTTATSSWGGELSFENSGPMVFGCVQFQTTPSLTEATDSQPWAGYLTGELDELRVFDKALSDTEVVDLYDSEKPN